MTWIAVYFTILLINYFPLFRCTSPYPPPDSEIQALNDLYVSTNGIYWTYKPVSTNGQEWNFSTAVVNPCDDWQGVFCIPHPTMANYSTVVDLKLDNYNLTGPIPTQPDSVCDGAKFPLLMISYQTKQLCWSTIYSVFSQY